MFSPASRGRLTLKDLDRFAGRTLFDRLGRVVCRAGCLPRKELFETWEVARRTRRVFRGGRVVDLAGGHGLLAVAMLLLDDSSPLAVVVDRETPPSAARILAVATEEWPRLVGRVVSVRQSLDEFDLGPSDIVVSSHACGALTDTILGRATRARARVAVLPCCHDDETCDAGPLTGWLDRAMAVDVLRAMRLEALGYRVRTQVIPAAITPKNRLLLGEPHTEEGTELKGMARPRSRSGQARV